MTHAIKNISLNGTELGYSVHGAGSGKAPVVFTHGYAMRSTAGLYDEVLERLARRHTVHALDLRGHGASAAAAVAGWSHGALADDLAAFSRALELERPVFVGHSFGAVMGLFAEIRHPGAFSALCLLSPGPANPTQDPVDTLEFLVEHGRDRDPVRESFGKMFVRPPGRTLDLAVDAVTLVNREVHRAAKEQNAKVSIEDRLEEVAAPVLLLRGERDRVVPPERQDGMARKLPRFKEVIFSTEGHMLPIENAAMVAREVIAFLEHDRESLASHPR